MTMILDLPESEYHQHPALSYSTGKHYLTSPAHYRWAVDHPTEKVAFDVGHAVHAMVLGVGAKVVEIPKEILAKNGAISTDAAKAWVAEQRKAGAVPLKAEAIKEAREAAEAILANRDARRLLEQPGAPEVALLATDPETGVDIRGKLDWLPDPSSGRTFPVDVKTTADAHPRKVVRTMADLDYDLQAAMYRRLLRLHGREDIGPFCFIFAEKDPPYGVTVVQVAHEDWIDGGEAKLNRILRLHAECLRTGDWSQAYPPGIHPLPPPGFYLADLDSRLEPTS